MRSLSFMLLALAVSIYYTDIEANNGFQSLFLPSLIFYYSVVWLCG